LCIVIVVIIERLPDPAGNADLVKGVFSGPVFFDNIGQERFDPIVPFTRKDHLHHPHLDDFCDLRGIAPSDLEAHDIGLVDVFSLFPDEIAGIPLLLAGLEEPFVDLLELDGEEMDIGAQFVLGKLLVTRIEGLLDRPGSSNRLFRVKGRQLDHAGVRVAVDDFVPLLLDGLPGMFDDCPSNGRHGSPDLPVKEPEPGVPRDPVIGVHDHLEHVLLHVIQDVLRRTEGEGVPEVLLLVPLF
jgi:hypothetical protein